MEIQNNQVKGSFLLSFILLTLIMALSFITIPFENIVIAVLSFILALVSIYQLNSTVKMSKLLIKTGEILSKGNERNFSKVDSSDKHIINQKISDLIGQLEDSVKQNEDVLAERDFLQKQADRLKAELESKKLSVSRQTIDIKGQLQDSLMAIDMMIADFGHMADSCQRQGESLKSLEEIYKKYNSSYSDVNTSISKTIEISGREIDRGNALEESIGELYASNEKSIEKIQSVYKSIGNIKEVTEIINEIAEKATVLSLNAAIESAHAGEAGKGFSVVAEEVGVLADTTGEHAEFINEALYSVTDLIEGSQYQTDNSDLAYDELTSGVKMMINAFETIKELFHLIETENFDHAIDFSDKNQKEKSRLLHNRQILEQLKKDLELNLEKISQIPLFEQGNEEKDSLSVSNKFEIYDTAVKTVSDEESEEEVK